MASTTYDLPFVQGATFTRVFTADDIADFRPYTIKAQVRQREQITAPLLLDLSPYFTTSADGSSVTLRVPATVTAAVDAAKFGTADSTRQAKWDMFLIETDDPTTAELFLQGNATCDPAATDTEATA